MKKMNIIITSILLFTAAAVWSGCDKFESFPVNIPVTVEFLTTGSNTTLTETIDFCMDANSETYQEYQDKIQSLTFIEAAYRTTGVSDASLRGDIQLTLQTQGGGTTLFSVLIPNARPADFLNSAFKLNLSEAQIQAINSYVTTLSNKCFRATVTISNISGGSAPYTLQGAIDMVFEAETEL